MRCYNVQSYIVQRNIVTSLFQEYTVCLSIVSGEYKSVLLEDIDAEQLPACYGGTLVDPDGDTRCPSKVGNHNVLCNT